MKQRVRLPAAAFRILRLPTQIRQGAPQGVALPAHGISLAGVCLFVFLPSFPKKLRKQDADHLKTQTRQGHVGPQPSLGPQDQRPYDGPQAKTPGQAGAIPKAHQQQRRPQQQGPQAAPRPAPQDQDQVQAQGQGHQQKPGNQHLFFALWGHGLSPAAVTRSRPFCLLWYRASSAVAIRSMARVPCPGAVATPMLTVTRRDSPRRSNTFVATASRMRSATNSAPSMGVKGSKTTNSSPP